MDIAIDPTIIPAHRTFYAFQDELPGSDGRTVFKLRKNRPWLSTSVSLKVELWGHSATVKILIMIWSS